VFRFAHAAADQWFRMALQSAGGPIARVSVATAKHGRRHVASTLRIFMEPKEGTR
jgi:hypothetical protein